MLDKHPKCPECGANMLNVVDSLAWICENHNCNYAEGAGQQISKRWALGVSTLEEVQAEKEERGTL